MLWKKCLIFLGVLLGMFQISLPISAQEIEEHQLSGYYLSEEDRFIKGYYFADQEIWLFINPNQLGDYPDSQVYTKLLALKQEGLTNLIDPDISSEEIKEMRQDLGIKSSSEIVDLLQEEITDAMSLEAIHQFINKQQPGIYFEVGPQMNVIVKLYHPQVSQRDGRWFVQVNQQEVFNFKLNQDKQELFDNYSGTYLKDE